MIVREIVFDNKFWMMMMMNYVYGSFWLIYLPKASWNCPLRSGELLLFWAGINPVGAFPGMAPHTK
jgi:hypothetical protein